MSSTPLYTESQRFTQRWVWLILVIAFVVCIVFAINAYGRNHQWTALFPIVLIILIGLLFRSARLTTTIDAESLHFRFSPFHYRPQVINKQDIREISVDRYNPIADYGGWGIRFGLKGKAFNVKGNTGINIRYGNNKKILIGTQQPQEVYSFLTQTGYHPGSNILPPSTSA